MAGQRMFCTAGWLQNDGNCYYFSSRKKSWEESKKFCESQDAQLLVIKDNSTLSFIRDNSNGTGYFVGLTKTRLSWQWIDGTLLDKFLNIHGSWSSFSCARVSSGELWQEVCLKSFQWICEKKAYELQRHQPGLLPPFAL
ncbi:killer cell lectin-like receptor subfamily F member 1 [Microcaecilia unicolor]|uniref:Killer cell lectin-like receptor subfamily F member 1 n=1 Tax=Microcaecilia unicolor TaxID=1415580 RepID=A0A6P7XC03_9AMPH|nr:killer cell lectin-like receptor subfamily F member 1 [Microcaecilia unicolor]